MHESLLGRPPSENYYAGYLKIEEGKNNWVEYWVVIRDNLTLLYSDECSEESGEEAIKTIALSSETRCELLQRRNYHFRFKLTIGASTSYRLKCSSAFHRQQWISNIMLASSKDRDGVIELNPSMYNGERNGVRRRTQSTESQISSDAESGQESDLGLDLSGTLSDGATSSAATTPESPTKAAPERRSSKGLLRRLSFKTSSRLRRDSKPSPREERGLGEMGTSSAPCSPSSRKTQSPMGSSGSLNGAVHRNKVFDNPAFVPSPESSPKISRQSTPVEKEPNLIDISQTVWFT